MIIKWLGHAGFLIECSGKRIITDPFGDHVGYAPIYESADFITISHSHKDHNVPEQVNGNPQILNQVGEHQEKDITFRGIPSFHDQMKGKQRGANIIFSISSEGMNVVHLGDLGHVLIKEQLSALGPVDILLMPVGGNYTIDADGAWEVYQQLRPPVVIPMHFKTPVCTLDVAPAEAFLRKFDKVIKKPFLQVSSEDLQGESRVVVLDYLS
ncbi:MAG TPA: MBL fold metallo-hydrolase [Syntrophomonadaceae bacterium]|nr:MBL fold metallo-hydrolase [Syntrophomonadaceae bacterium]